MKQTPLIYSVNILIGWSVDLDVLLGKQRVSLRRQLDYFFIPAIKSCELRTATFRRINSTPEKEKHDSTGDAPDLSPVIFGLAEK
jgi:hypothetical protein